MSAEHGIFGRGSAEHPARRGKLDDDDDGVLASVDSEVMTPQIVQLSNTRCTGAIDEVR